jgi:hypothetical protein
MGRWTRAPGDADATAIRAAAQDVLSDPSYRLVAKRMSASLAGVDGAANAADEIEALVVSQGRDSPTADRCGGDRDRVQRIA